ncbi:MAG: biotin/lipoyl-containing protein [Bacteroidota bacterium]
MSTFDITIGESTTSLTPEDLSEYDIADLGAGKYHVLHNKRAFHVEINSIDRNHRLVELTVNDVSFDVKIEDAFDILVKEMGLHAQASQKMKNVKAPMPGLVLEIIAEAGAEIEKGTPLLILEAMKMENVIKADGEGVIKSIEVTKGAAVDKGQVLIEME